MYVNLHTRLGITVFYNSVAAAIYLEDRVIFGLGGKEICCASLVAAHPSLWGGQRRRAPCPSLHNYPKVVPILESKKKKRIIENLISALDLFRKWNII